MRGNIKQQGHFELFVSERAHRLLMLDDNTWFRWEWDEPIPKLYLSKGVVDKSGDKEYSPLRQGRYYIVESTTGAFSGFPHLLLENDNFFDIYRLPSSLPGNLDYESEIIDIHEKVPTEDVDTCFYQLNQ
jgi:hypothetical protein